MTQLHDGTKAEKKSTRITARIFAIVAAAIWCVALFSPTYCDNMGLLCLLCGWFMIASLAFVAWVGNILAGVAVFMLFFGTKRETYLRAAKLGFFAVCFSLAAVVDYDIPGEHLKSSAECSPQYGVYIWILSVAVVFAGAVVAYQKHTD